MPEGPKEIRWQTTNTKLATALLVMGFPLAKQPFTSVVGGSTTIYFGGGVLFDKVVGGVLTGNEVEERWRTCLDKEDELLPWLGWMRAALVERDNLLSDVVHGDAFPTSGSIIQPDWFCTDDLHVAAALRALGHKLMWFHDRRFFFSPKCKKDAARYFETEAKERVAIHWMRCALDQQQVLIETIRDRRNTPIKRFKGKKKDSFALIPQNMPEDLARRTLRELHR